MGKTEHRDNFKFGKEPKKKEKYKIKDYYKGKSSKDLVNESEELEDDYKH